MNREQKPDGQSVASASREGGSYLIDPETGAQTRTEWTDLNPAPPAEPLPVDKKKVK